jgi:DNA-binding PadR family transcriptional regulator
MLSKKEIAVMRVVFDAAKKNNDSAILSAKYILGSMPEKYRASETRVETTLKQLEYDGYIECTKSDKKGEIVNVITLKQKGKAFARELILRRREVVNTFVWRIVFAGAGAVAALIVSNLLKLIG